MEIPAISLQHITKEFSLMQTRYGLKGMVMHLPNYLRDRFSPQRFTALSDVSLTIQRGETVGVTGANGCGKTTLLSIVGNVLKNYSGTREVNGRISMMLALKSGFVNSLSGRENIMINGVLQGMSRRAMRALTDEIIDFSGIGRFIDSPVYQYSSGMQARLGFAIATAIKPDILLVDEVMAVGDEEFRQRCRVRMNELIAGHTTLMLVSHKMGDLKEYCSRIVKLDQGVIVQDSATEEFFRQQEAEKAAQKMEAKRNG